MTWQFGPTRFVHVSCHIGESVRPVVRARPWIPGMSGGLAGAPSLTADREERLLVALISTLSDYEGRCGEWPPSRVDRLLDLAGSDRVTGALRLPAQSDASRDCIRPLTRPGRKAVLVAGLAALDTGLKTGTDAAFDELCPIHRGQVLGAFVRGDLGHPREAAERFMDCLIETVTFAFLNFEFEPCRLSSATFDSVRAPCAS